MRFSAGLPGEQRQDKDLTAEVKKEKGLGERSGKWEKFLYPPQALEAIKSKQNEARQYHASMTLPFDNGTGILPGALIPEYREKLRVFSSEINHLVETTFLADPRKWIDWAVKEHNGTFNPANYPGCSVAADGSIAFDPDQFRTAMRKKFYFRSDPIPVPDSTQFESTVASLLGTDTESVNCRVRDAVAEGQADLMKRLLDPVKKMVETLGKDKPRIYDSLIGNVADILRVAPALNLSGNPLIDQAIKDVQALVQYEPDSLRKSEGTRDAARAAAEATLKRLQGYQF